MKSVRLARQRQKRRPLRLGIQVTPIDMRRKYEAGAD